MEDINNESKWTKFVQKLLSLTKDGKLVWKDISHLTSRERATSPMFCAEIVGGKHVVAYRFAYRRYTDEDEFEVLPEIAIELADNVGESLWRLPQVAPRYALMDQIEFQNADAGTVLEMFLKETA